MRSTQSIVVGYDGSVEAGRAVRWAAHQADLRHCELHLVHCSLWPLLTHDLGPVEGIADSGLQHYSEAVLAEGLDHATNAAPQVKIRTSLLYGWPAEHLRTAAAGATMLVVGSRGIGGFMGLLVGSVSLELAATASCPVAVIRSEENPGGPVVVGVEHPGNTAALADACALASAAGVGLVVVHVRRIHFGVGKPGGAAGESLSAARELLDSAVQTARAAAPGLEVSEELVEDSSVPRGLLKMATDASVVVVGSKGHGLIRGTIGSSAHAVLHHARCPVFVSRHAAEEPKVQQGHQPPS
jgi:nucleotide-binding universal stress UspA family protein